MDKDIWIVCISGSFLCALIFGFAVGFALDSIDYLWLTAVVLFGVLMAALLIAFGITSLFGNITDKIEKRRKKSLEKLD